MPRLEDDFMKRVADMAADPELAADLCAAYAEDAETVYEWQREYERAGVSDDSMAEIVRPIAGTITAAGVKLMPYAANLLKFLNLIHCLLWVLAWKVKEQNREREREP